MKTVISSSVYECIKDVDLSTSKGVIEALSSVWVSSKTQGLNLSGKDFDNVLKAVQSNEYVVDTGLYYINIAEYQGDEEFLCADKELQDDGTYKFRWYFDTFANAKPMSMQTIETYVPVAYRHPDLLLIEQVAKEKYGKGV